MLHKFLTNFSHFTTDETLVAAMFNVAATRYFNATLNANYDQTQREAIGYAITSRVCGSTVDESKAEAGRLTN